MTFLKGTPGALQLVFTQWAEQQQFFFGKYTINVTVAALSLV
jgi:hypothetical protein